MPVKQKLRVLFRRLLLILLIPLSIQIHCYSLDLGIATKRIIYSPPFWAGPSIHIRTRHAKSRFEPCSIKTSPQNESQRL